MNVFIMEDLTLIWQLFSITGRGLSDPQPQKLHLKSDKAEDVEICLYVVGL